MLFLTPWEDNTKLRQLIVVQPLRKLHQKVNSSFIGSVFLVLQPTIGKRVFVGLNLFGL